MPPSGSPGEADMARMLAIIKHLVAENKFDGWASWQVEPAIDR